MQFPPVSRHSELPRHVILFGGDPAEQDASASDGPTQLPAAAEQVLQWASNPPPTKDAQGTFPASGSDWRKNVLPALSGGGAIGSLVAAAYRWWRG